MSYHEPPSYYGYKSGTFSKVTKCNNCGTVGLGEDCFYLSPCKYCGGVVYAYGAAKWVPPVYKGVLWWRKVVKKGYWAKPDIKGVKHEI